jgi:hypothetical protein
VRVNVQAVVDVFAGQRIGWSSTALGATPVWPCLKSKNATPDDARS